METKSEPIVVTRKGLEIIEYLDVPDERRWLDVTQFQANACAALEKKGLIDTATDGKVRVAILTELGRNSRFDVLVEGSREYFEYRASQNGRANTPIDEASSVQEMHTAQVAQPAAAVPPPLATSAACVDECSECVHREVLDLIAAKYPRVADLRDAMLTQKKLIKDLGL